jgi:hypothetical protein
MTIAEFLLARIAEDETAVLERAHDAPIHRVGCYYYNSSISPWRWTAGCCDCDDDGSVARRQLAECEAKRRIVADRMRIDRSADDSEWAMGYSDGNYDAVYAMAAVYADHPDYDSAWAL